MKGADALWPDGRRRCDGVAESEGRRCFDVGTHAVEGDVAPLRYCKLHGTEQARLMARRAVPA